MAATVREKYSDSRRSPVVCQGSASQRAPREREQEQAPGADDTAAGAGEEPRDRKPPVAPRSPDAPWHHAQPAFEEPKPQPERQPEPESASRPDPEPEPEPNPDNSDDPAGGTR